MLRGFIKRSWWPIPKIVNNIEFKTLNQKIFYDIIGEEHTQLVLCHGIVEQVRLMYQFINFYKMF